MTESASTEVTKTKKRTSDVKVKDNVDFESLLLSEDVLTGLKTCGFQRPSPVQLKAIPLGRCGLDLVVQAKSGTGKTCVFSVIALESIVLKSQGTQVLILAPTREIAVQIWEVINSMGSAMPKLRCYTFIGGMPISDDKVKLKKCHIAVGTPGRVKQLIEEQALNTESIRLFILDEADKLMEEGFQETINWIFSSLPENKQMLALSATYPEILAKHLTAYMRNPTFVRLNTNDLSLLGIRQYYKSVPFSPLQQKAFEIKCKVLMDLFNGISFQQCLVFSNYQLRAQSLSDVLNREGWPATYISGSQDQQDRLTAMSKLKTFKCRVLISTDLTSRGIDAENVNLIINMDIPHDHETYLHRIGRAGRFGTYGAAITLVSLGKEMANLKAIENRANTKILPLPDPIPPDLAQASGYVDYSDHITVESMTDIEKNSANSTELIMGDTHERTERASVLPCDSLNDFKYQPVKTALEQNQEGDISVVKDYEALSQQTVNGDNMYAETSPDVEGLITTLESTVISEYAKMEQLLAFSDVTASGDAGTSCLPENGPNCSQRQLDLAPVHPASETYQMSDSKGCTSSEVSEQQVTLANSVPCNLKLPNAQMLQRFSKAINICHVNVPDFVLPNLGDITGRKKTSLSSYDDMMANYEQFQKTGESLQHSYQNLDSFDSSTYDAALQKVDAFFKCRQLERSKINIDSLEIGASCGRNPQEVEITSKVQDITADKKQDDLPVAMSSGKLDVCFTDSPVQFKEFGVKKCSNEAKGVGKTVTTANIAAVLGCVKSAEDNDKLVGFSELSSYFADSNTPGSPSSHGTGKKTCTKLGSPSACQTKECANKYMASPHRSTEDQKLGLDLMRRLQARHEADISEIDLSSSGSDTESDDAYTVGSSSNHDLGKNDRDEICDRFYINLESGALEGNTRYPEQPAYTHWPTFESAYEQQFAGNIGQPAYDYQSLNGCNYASSQMNASYWHSGGMGPFPYQLWMQCANLLGSINAVQAAQYSWYCQQWYVYHRKCAKLYIDQYKKYKSKLK